ncbi:MAG: arsenate reductase (glutaredoxin) [Magnetococcales bacterium]|nr:arsenate reductase (glutaredoxin) [Magnetococcales bacterium]
MSKVTIYHNPRCKKSREGLALLQEEGIEPEVVQYLKTPLDKPGLEELLTLLGLEPRALLRKQEAAYKENNLKDPALSRDALIEAMVAHPKLIERPIVVANGKAVLGRPKENILQIL